MNNKEGRCSESGSKQSKSVMSTKSSRKMSIKESNLKYIDLMEKQEKGKNKTRKLEEELKLREL